MVISRPGSYHLLKAGVPSTALSTLLTLSGFSLTIPLRCWCYVNQRFVFSASLFSFLTNIIALNFPGKQIHLYWKNYWAIEILAKVSLIRQRRVWLLHIQPHLTHLFSWSVSSCMSTSNPSFSISWLCNVASFFHWQPRPPSLDFLLCHSNLKISLH